MPIDSVRCTTDHPGVSSRDDERIFLVGLATLSASLLTVAAVLWLLSRTFVFQVDGELFRKLLFIQMMGSLRPEPMERFLYLSGLILLPLCLTVWYLFFNRSRKLALFAESRRHQTLLVGIHFLPPLLVVGAALGLVLPQVAHTFWLQRQGLPSALALGITLPLALALVGRPEGSHSRGRAGSFLRHAPAAAAGVIILGIFLFCLFDEIHVAYIDIFYVSFEAFFSSVVQVVHGKELLVDFTNQYGLYPHLLEPLFSIIGLSVLKFTTVMGLLLGLSLYGVYRFLSAEVTNRWLALLGFASIVYLGHAGPRFSKIDFYFQYYPLRFVVPAASILLAGTYLRRPSCRIRSLVFALAAVGILWNFETGLVVLGSWILLLVAEGFYLGNVKRLILSLAGGVALVAAVMGAFALYLRLRYGHYPDFLQMAGASKYFYLMGYAMLPMEVFHPWILVMVTYATGLLLSLGALVRRQWTPRAGMLLYLSVLGCGLFAQFQGRSVNPNLLATSYPAVIIAILLADDLRGSLRKSAFSGERALYLIVLTTLVFSTTALVASSPQWLEFMQEKLRAYRRPPNQVALNAAFIRGNTRPGEDVLIVSPLASIYHLASGTRTPLNVPGLAEMILASDFEKIVSYASSGQGKFIVDGMARSGQQWASSLLKHANSVESSPDGMVFIANGGL